MSLVLGDNFSYKGAKPLDARLSYSTVAEMKAAADSTLYDGIIAYCKGADKTYQWKITNTVDDTTGKWREFSSGGGSADVDDELSDTSENPVQNKVIKGALDKKQDRMQLTTLPTADADHVGQVVQYIGATTASLTHGYVYECVSDGAANPTFSWKETEVQKSYPQRSISKADFDALPQTEKDNGTTYFIPDANIVTDFTVMGNRFDKANIYTADERMIGSWMGKPLYQKTVELSNIPSGTTTNFNMDTIIGNNIEVAFKSNVWGIRSDNSIKDSEFVFGTNDKLSALIQKYNGQWNIIVATGAAYSKVYVTLQYTKTTDATVSIGTGNDYSTEEQIIGTWIDGKPLYQKTIDCGALPNSASKLIDLSALNIDLYISTIGVSYNSSYVYAFPKVSTKTGAVEMWYNRGTKNLEIRTQDNLSGYTNNFLVIQYTKTTD